MSWFWIAPLLALGSFLVLRKRREREEREGPAAGDALLARLAEVLREDHPSVELLGTSPGGETLFLRLDRQEMAVPLGPLRLQARAFPSAFGSTVDSLVAELGRQRARVGDLPFDIVIPHLLPQVRTLDWLASHAPSFGPGRLLAREIGEDLVMTFVIDEPGGLVFVTQAHLEAWGCRLADLANLALTNLRLLAERQGVPPVPRPEGGPAFGPEEGHEASRLLLALGEGGRDLVFGVPDRDSLCVERRDGDLASLRRTVEERFREGPHPISPELFELGGGRCRKLPSPG